MTDDELKVLAKLLQPYRDKVEAAWGGRRTPKAEPVVTTELLTVPEAAARIGCSRSHIYNLIAAGKLARYDIGLKGTKVRLSDIDVDRYIAEAQVPLPRMDR